MWGHSYSAWQSQVCAEEKVEGNFDDLMALAQIGSPMITKMTIARNYWDEMGNGKPDAAHTVMLENTTRWLLAHAIDPGFDLGQSWRPRRPMPAPARC